MLYNNDNITATAVDTTSAQAPVDKTRRKRLKVVSACSECRRKKTKCNGEKPCAGCIKTNVECKYANSAAKNKQQKQQTQRPQQPQSQTQTHQQKPQPQAQRSLLSHDTPSLQVQAQPQPQPQSQPSTSYPPSYHNEQQQQKEKTTAMIQAIEQRLSVIEDILQVFLANSNLNNKQTSVPQQYHQNHYQHSAVGPYHGDYYPNNKRKYSDYYSQDESLKLPPPHNYQPTLSESSSTSTTSSVCSTGSSPKISAIQTLLNNDQKDGEDYPAPPVKRPSAFFRPTPSNNHTIASGAGSPPIVIHHRDYYSAHGTVAGSV